MAAAVPAVQAVGHDDDRDREVVEVRGHAAQAQHGGGILGRIADVDPLADIDAVLAKHDGLQEDGFGGSEQDRAEGSRHGTGAEALDVMSGGPAGDMAPEQLHGAASGRAAQEGVLADLLVGMGVDVRHGDQPRVEEAFVGDDLGSDLGPAGAFPNPTNPSS